MFCPLCRDEYRPGFTRCATCDVALVETLDLATPSAPVLLVTESVPEDDMVVFCGFLTLDEAREARKKVREAKLPADILIRESPGTAAAEPGHEEFWLRVRTKDIRPVEGLIGSAAEVQAGADDVFGCSSCGATVHASDEACPGCGLRFEE